MSRIKQPRQIHDHELAAKGLCRVAVREWIRTSDGLAYVSREVTVKQSERQDSVIPWWKREPTRKRRQKK